MPTRTGWLLTAAWLGTASSAVAQEQTTDTTTAVTATTAAADTTATVAAETPAETGTTGAAATAAPDAAQTTVATPAEPGAAVSVEVVNPFPRAAPPPGPEMFPAALAAVSAPGEAAGASVAGEDEGGPVPSAPPQPEPAPIQVQGVAVVPGAVAEAGASGDTDDWITRLAGVSESSPLLQLRTGPLVVAPIGLVQLLGVPWQGDAARIANGGLVDEAGLRLRRVRIGFRGLGPWGLSFESVSEFDADGARLLDLSMTWAPFEALALSAGASKAPFSGSMLTPAMFQTFLDRPWGVDGRTGDGERAGVAPGRMLGVWLGGRWSVLRWQAGVYNGNEDYFVGNDNNGMLYGARLECLPLGDLPDGQLMVEGGEPRLRIGGAYFFNDDAAGNTHGAEGDVKFRWRGLTVEGEFLWSTFALAADPTRPPDLAADIARMAYYAQVGYLVYEDWAEVAARFDSFELDDGVDDFNDRWTVAGVATLFLLRNRVKLQLEYAHHQEWAEPQVANDSVALQLQGRF